jgi:hypothetical protein
VTYCYTTIDGTETIDKDYPMGGAPERIRQGGRRYRRDRNAEWSPRLRHQQIAEFGYFSDSMAVLPSQRKELSDHLAKCGVPTYVNAKGQPEVRSEAHKRAQGRARRMCDQNSYY